MSGGKQDEQGPQTMAWKLLEYLDHPHWRRRDRTKQNRRRAKCPIRQFLKFLLKAVQVERKNLNRWGKNRVLTSGNCSVDGWFLLKVSYEVDALTHPNRASLWGRAVV